MYTQSLLCRAIRSYFVTSWLNLYQSSEASIFWILWSLVKPVLSKTALPCWSRLALACPFYIRSSACIAVIFLLIWQPPAFPYRHQYSIIGRFRLNHRVRDVDGCFPKAHRHQKTASRALALHALEVSSKLLYQSAFISNAFGSGQLHSFMFLTEWRWRDSNSWPPACKAGALPTELHPHLEYSKFSFFNLAATCFPIPSPV